MVKLKPYHFYNVDSESGKVRVSTRAVYYKGILYMVHLYSNLSRNPNPFIELIPLRDEYKERATLIEESKMADLEKLLVNALKKGSTKIKVSLDVVI